MAGNLSKSDRRVGSDRVRIVPKNSGVPGGRRRLSIIKLKREEEVKNREIPKIKHASYERGKGVTGNITHVFAKAKKIQEQIQGEIETSKMLNEFGDFLLLVSFEEYVHLDGPEKDIYMIQIANIAVEHYGEAYGEALFSMLLQRLSDYAGGRDPKIIHDKSKKPRQSKNKTKLTEGKREKYREGLREKAQWS